MKLQEIQANTKLRGVLVGETVTVINVHWYGSEALELTYKTSAGKVSNRLLYRSDEDALEVIDVGGSWSFDGDGALFRLVSEARRIRLAHLFDPVLAVHTSVVEPLPHQITAVYESMLQRQPLRFLLADDPGAGKTIMAGLLIKELIVRGDLLRCLVVCPGSLAEQWQDELRRRFQLSFDILTNDKLEAASSGNWFLESNLVIARLDKMSRDEGVQQLLRDPKCHWDLVICDEAHKMSATYTGGEVKYTKRYHLGKLLSSTTRHFLLMTATPHNGKDEDFQLFMALIDGDRFEGRARSDTQAADLSDLMRRMVKEKLLKFDGTPLFPERKAHTIPYKLSELEANLYKSVTEYVREQFNRADALENNKRAGTVGFALTILQRRLASSPEAIHQSLRRRCDRLGKKLIELEAQQSSEKAAVIIATTGPVMDEDDFDDFDESPDEEVEAKEEEVMDQATAAMSIAELKAELDTLNALVGLSYEVKNSGTDTKWQELGKLIEEIFTTSDARRQNHQADGSSDSSQGEESPQQKLVVFTEHRDTLSYLQDRITTLLGNQNSVRVIHGGLKRKERHDAQEAFLHNQDVLVLLATDAAGEGINLQRAHLMVNYDLPWNPNRLEQRFGRIHRIGQTEVCQLWNLVASETREGDVYKKLLDKLVQVKEALGGQVFDVLGKLHFEGKSLRDLLIDAIRHGEKHEERQRLTTAIEHALDLDHLQDLLAEHSLAQDAMDTSRVQRVREDMERAEASRLQPHYIESFFLEAFRKLGGSLKKREAGRFEIRHVPARVQNQRLLIRSGDPVLPNYERITFEKSLISPQGKPLAAFICPGHPLMDAVIELTLEDHRDLLRRGTILVDERDMGTRPRVLYYLEHSIQDATVTQSGVNRIISKRMLYVEINEDGSPQHKNYAPYLDYRPLADGEPEISTILERPECSWVKNDLESIAQTHAVINVAPEHLREVQEKRHGLIAKTKEAVKARLTKEIAHWDRRAEELKLQEKAGDTSTKLKSGEASRRADKLKARLDARMAELELEEQMTALPPIILGGVLVVPQGLLQLLVDDSGTDATVSTTPDTQESAARARNIIMDIERELGFEPTDREFEKLGYDIESRIPSTGQLRFIEVKGRVSDATTITVTRNEILYSLNKPQNYILGIVEFLENDKYKVHYVRKPFQSEPEFGVTSVNYDLKELIDRAHTPS